MSKPTGPGFMKQVAEIRERKRLRAIAEIKEICQEIGCSGLSPQMCQQEPHKCGIIRKIMNPIHGKQEGGT